MAYAGIDKNRFARLLEWGVADVELRRFFQDSKTQLMIHRGKVQNLPHGKPARIKKLVQELPPSTDKVIQKWFSENLTITDPILCAEALDTLRMYEDAGESVPESEANRLARSCLYYLFLENPPQNLMDYLKPTKDVTPANAVEPTEEDKENSASPVSLISTERLSIALANALIALAEGQDPDEHLPSLPSTLASLIDGIYAVRIGRREQAQSALESLTEEPAVRELLAEYANRSEDATTRGNVPGGLQFISLSEVDPTTSFDIERDDEIMAICTRDFPESSVFVRPFAIRTAKGAWFSLATIGVREKIFYTSGDVIVRSGQRRQQPKRREIGLWRVALNENHNPSHQTNFHTSSKKTPVFEVRDVPFSSEDYDNVREYIKHQAKLLGETQNSTTLFLLKDRLIVGWPSGKDLTKDEDFDGGLPCWAALQAIQFEGRRLVPGPLPKSDTYECETLASSLRKLLASDKSESEKPTKAQLKTIQELIISGKARIDAIRVKRLRAELAVIDEHEGAIEALLETIMAQPKIADRVSQLVKEQADASLMIKNELQESIERLRKEKIALADEKKRLEREYRSISPTITKAIRNAFDKARNEAAETLSQAAVFNALISNIIEPPNLSFDENLTGKPVSHISGNSARIRQAHESVGSSILEMLRHFGIPPKQAHALQVVGQLAQACGLILIVEGVAARLVAESWLINVRGSGAVLESQIGLIDDSYALSVMAELPAGLAILDANLSPLDVYARPLIDTVMKQIIDQNEEAHNTLIVFSLSNSVAALPISPVVESISLRISLDQHPQFLSETDAAQRLEEITSSDDPAEWIACLWKPAASRVKKHLQSMSTEDVSLVLSVL